MNLSKAVLGMTLILVIAAALGAMPWGGGAPAASTRSATTALASAVSVSGPSATAATSTIATFSAAPAVATTAPSVTLGPVSPHVAALNLPGPRPNAWGSLDLPPGMPSLAGAGPAAPSTSGDPPNPCFAVSSSTGGQSILPASCVGHD